MRRSLGPYARVEKNVFEYIIEERLISPGDRVLAAVSGGPDSIALLFLLYRMKRELKFELCAAYIDHRSNVSSAKEREYVENACRGLGIRFLHEKLPLPPRTGNTEAYWRYHRYRALESLAESSGCARIATGHNMHDQAETVFLRLIRGTLTAGLRGILPSRDDGVIRPLLRCRKNELCDMLEFCGINFMQDPGNSNMQMARNRLRMRVLKDDDEMISTLAALADCARVFENAISKEYADAFIMRALPDGAGLELNLAFIQKAGRATARDAIRRSLILITGSIRKFNRGHIQSILALCDKGAFTTTGDFPGIRVYRAYDRTFILKTEHINPCTEWSVEVSGPGTYRVDELDASIRIPDTRMLDFPLLLRNRRMGDRLWQSSTKLKTLLIKRHVPVFLRSRMPLLASGDRVLWLPDPMPRIMHGLEIEVTMGDDAWWKCLMHQPQGVDVP